MKNPKVVDGELGYLAELIAAALISPNEADSNGEPANVVDGLHRIAGALHHIARAIEAGHSAEVTSDDRAGEL